MEEGKEAHVIFLGENASGAAVVVEHEYHSYTAHVLVAKFFVPPRRGVSLQLAVAAVTGGDGIVAMAFVMVREQLGITIMGILG